MSRIRIMTAGLATLAVLFFHRVMPWYEFWPLLALASLVVALTTLGRRASRHWARHRHQTSAIARTIALHLW